MAKKITTSQEQRFFIIDTSTREYFKSFGNGLTKSQSEAHPYTLAEVEYHFGLSILGINAALVPAPEPPILTSADLSHIEEALARLDAATNALNDRFTDLKNQFFPRG